MKSLYRRYALIVQLFSALYLFVRIEAPFDIIGPYVLDSFVHVMEVVEFIFLVVQVLYKFI